MRTKSSPTPLGYSTKFHTGMFRPMVQLFTLLYTILIDKAPLSCTILLKRVTPRDPHFLLVSPFTTYFFKEHCIPFPNLRFQPPLVSDFISSRFPEKSLHLEPLESDHLS